MDCIDLTEEDSFISAKSPESTVTVNNIIHKESFALQRSDSCERNKFPSLVSKSDSQIENETTYQYKTKQEWTAVETPKVEFSKNEVDSDIEILNLATTSVKRLPKSSRNVISPIELSFDCTLVSSLEDKNKNKESSSSSPITKTINSDDWSKEQNSNLFHTDDEDSILDCGLDQLLGPSFGSKTSDSISKLGIRSSFPVGKATASIDDRGEGSRKTTRKKESKENCLGTKNTSAKKRKVGTKAEQKEVEKMLKKKRAADRKKEKERENQKKKEEMMGSKLYTEKLIQEGYNMPNKSITERDIGVLHFKRKCWSKPQVSHELYAVGVEVARDPDSGKTKNTWEPVLEKFVPPQTDRLLLLVWNGEKFLSQLKQDILSGSGTYPRIGSYIDFATKDHKQRFRKNSTGSSRIHIIVILENIYDELAKVQRKTASKQRSGAGTWCRIDRTALQDAIGWLYVAFRVEVRISSSNEETADILLNLSKAVASRPYKLDPSPLDALAIYKTKSMNKIKDDGEAQLTGKGKGNKYKSISSAQYKEMWVNMLRCFPRISEKYARYIVEAFPTFRSLYSEYIQDSLSDVEKENLILKAFTTSKTQPRALSKAVYQHFTTNDSTRILF